MNKTAMMQLRNRLQEEIKEERYHIAISAYQLVINLINTELLEIEKQNIINAVDGFPLCNRDLNGEDYYLKTFNPK
jgi:hypothetical protein